MNEKRFSISTESLKRFKSLRDSFEALQKKYTYLSGLGFFGSRTKGAETEISDYDVCFFYNSVRITQIGMGTRDEWEEIITQLQSLLDTTFDHRIHFNSAGLRINISYENTIHSLEMFIEEVDDLSKIISEETLIFDAINPLLTQDLCARFFLGIGDELYENRKLILDYLQSLKHGETYLRLLMAELAYFEQFNKRDPVSISSKFTYPSTFDEVRTMFKLPAVSNS